MLNFLFQTGTAASTAFLSQCQYNIAFLNYDGWIGITVLVILISLLAAAAVYAFSGPLPGNTRERLRGVVKFEYIQGIFSIILVIALFSMSLSACAIGGELTQGATTNYQDPFQFANYYIGNLLFSKGLTLTTSMFSEGVVLVIDAFFVTYALSFAGSFIPPLSVKGFSILPAIATSDQPATVIYDYSSVLNLLLEPIVVVTFGLLFVVFLALPAIEALSLTLIIPVAIIMRSLSFTGPRLREASNALIAIAIAFYFILPLTIAMNYYVVNWTYCLNGGSCNPYASTYLQPYKVNSLPLSQLFTNPEVQNIQGLSVSVPYNFYAAEIQSNGGFSAIAKQVATALVTMPQQLDNFVDYTAQYLFQAIFLIGLDVGITIGFAIGLHKGLESIGQVLGVGPFWSG